MRAAVKAAIFSGTAFNPRMLGPSLLGWWDANRLDRMTLSGSQVSSWRDVVGGYDAAQAVSGSRPLYQATGFNGAPCVYFDGVDDELVLGSVPFPAGSNPFELWGVVGQDALAADTGTRAAFQYGGGAGLNSTSLGRVVSSGVNRANGRVGNGSSTTQLTGSTVDFSGRHVVRLAVGASASSMYVDGILTGPTAVTPAVGTTRTTIGSSFGGGFWSGPVRQILRTAPLSTNQATQLQTWANAQRMV